MEKIRLDYPDIAPAGPKFTRGDPLRGGCCLSQAVPPAAHRRRRGR